MIQHPGALRLIASNLAAALKPRDPIKVSDWLAQNMVLVDGARSGSLWSSAGAPYLSEIADCLSDDHPCNLVTVRKSQQTGASILALGWALYVADCEPANMLFAAPNLSLLRDLNSAKLQPLIDAFHRRSGRRIIAPMVSRDGKGSTIYEKIFSRGGRLFLANANSVTDLSSKTVKKGIKDELSKWEPIPGAQDPEDLFMGRFTAFRGTGEWKILEISTPEFDTGDDTGEKAGHCRIDRSFKRSDQRFWQICCPECNLSQAQNFEQFLIDKSQPHRSRYMCEGCGHEISEPERRIALQPEHGARWVAKMPDEGRHPGFHIDAFCSLMMSYEAIAEDWLKGHVSEIGLKGFHNLTLGLPYQYRGDAPDHENLLLRREEHLVRGRIPHDALLLTAAADVQMRGIWLEIVAWTQDRRSYLVDAQYIGGDTDDPSNAAFAKLRAETIDRRFVDAFGKERSIDALAVDSGYASNTVYRWVRQNQTMHPDTGRDVVFAIKGVDNWSAPYISQPALVDIDLSGVKLKQGAKLWKIGSWPLKSSVYSMLNRERVASDFADLPSGYCHFGAWVDAEYFQQLTAECLEDVMLRGVSVGHKWRKMRADNHFLDTRVYNLAMAEHLGLSSMTTNEWATIAKRRGLPEAEPITLFTVASESQQPTAQKEKSVRAKRADWLHGRASQWD